MMAKRKPADPTAHSNLAREVEQKMVGELQDALNAYWEAIELKWMPMVQPLVSMAVRYGAATTPDQMILLETVYKEQLFKVVRGRVKFAADDIKRALDAIANSYGWQVVDIAEKPKKRPK